MHVHAAVELPNLSVEQVQGNAVQAILAEGWDVDTVAGGWVRAVTGGAFSFFPTEIEIGIAASGTGCSLVIDAEPNTFAIGPIWRSNMQKKVDGLVARLKTVSPTSPAPLFSPTDIAIKVPLGADILPPDRYERLSMKIDREGPQEAPPELQSKLLAMQRNEPGMGGGVGVGGGPNPGKWFLDKIGGAIVAILVKKVIDGVLHRPDPEPMPKPGDPNPRFPGGGKLEYDPSGGGRLVFRWPDGTVTDAPPAYQPHAAAKPGRRKRARPHPRRRKPPRG
jgi:hypothetical protein